MSLAALPSPGPGAGSLALRLLLAVAAVLLAAHLWAREAVALLLPALSAALSWVTDDFRILRFEFVQERGNTSIGALAVLEHTLVLGGRAIVPDGVSPLVAVTTVGTVMQPVLVAVSLALAWPARWPERALRLVLVGVLLAVVMLVDTPLSLAAWLWYAQLQAYEPGRASPLVWWNIFLNGGGRLALGLIAGALSIALARRIGGGTRNPEPISP